ncbi:MAG TPA: S1/P1 nuclease [Candidatus Binatia bacterium]|nr:S1/P1 nuclease [Candidatus Binatia bacterium]
MFNVLELVSRILFIGTTVFAFMLHCREVAYGWGEKGHRIVAILADTHLTAQAREEVGKLLPAGTTLADAAVWPDREGRQITEFDRLHHVSIPDDVEGYDQERDCKARNCMVEALDWFTSIITDVKVPINVRLIALRYVAHLVGDMHQPLHAGRQEDRNGTDITVSYRGQTNNLHLFWDINVVEMAEGNPEELAEKLDESITRKQRAKWQSGEPKTWTDESFRLSRSNAYTLGESMELSDEYVATALTIVRRRLAQAGVRLGWLLNNVFK